MFAQQKYFVSGRVSPGCAPLPCGPGCAIIHLGRGASNRAAQQSQSLPGIFAQAGRRLRPGFPRKRRSSSPTFCLACNGWGFHQSGRVAKRPPVGILFNRTRFIPLPGCVDPSELGGPRGFIFKATKGLHLFPVGRPALAGGKPSPALRWPRTFLPGCMLLQASTPQLHPAHVPKHIIRVSFSSFCNRNSCQPFSLIPKHDFQSRVSWIASSQRMAPTRPSHPPAGPVYRQPGLLCDSGGINPIFGQLPFRC